MAPPSKFSFHPLPSWRQIHIYHQLHCIFANSSIFFLSYLILEKHFNTHLLLLTFHSHHSSPSLVFHYMFCSSHWFTVFTVRSFALMGIIQLRVMLSRTEGFRTSTRTRTWRRIRTGKLVLVDHRGQGLSLRTKTLGYSKE